MDTKVITVRFVKKPWLSGEVRAPKHSHPCLQRWRRGRLRGLGLWRLRTRNRNTLTRLEVCCCDCLEASSHNRPLKIRRTHHGSPRRRQNLEMAIEPGSITCAALADKRDGGSPDISSKPPDQADISSNTSSMFLD